MQHKYKVGDVLTVRASKFLGVGECQARVITLTDQGYTAREEPEASAPNFGPEDDFDIDHDRYVLIGPPLNGKLVRAP